MRAMFPVLAVALGLVALPVFAQSLLPDRERIDSWLAPLGASDRFDPAKGIDWGIMPGPFYTPELGIGVGVAAVGMYRPDAMDSRSQNSTLSLSGYTSMTGAFGLNINNYTFFADDRWRFFLDGDISNTPTYYWGRGFTAGAHNHHKQKYTSRALDLRPMIYRQLAESAYIGIGSTLSVLHAAGIDHDDPQRIEHAVGGPSVLSSGLSVTLSWDDRDFVPNPRSGQLANIRYTRFTPKMGGDTQFDAWKMHLSRYHPLGSGSVLAWEVNGDFTQGHVPWNMLPLLGSNQRMRGYYEGRYRDRNVVSGQLEYRQKLSWRHGIVGWLGAGTMAPSFHTLGNRQWLPSAGVGYRFEFKPRMNVRLDYGVGKGSSGFYFQVGEAF